MFKRRTQLALTLAFAHNGLELTFFQVCTADQTSKVEFLNTNCCITTENDFAFVTKDFVKLTAEGRWLKGSLLVDSTTQMQHLLHWN